MVQLFLFFTAPRALFIFGYSAAQCLRVKKNCFKEGGWIAWLERPGWDLG